MWVPIARGKQSVSRGGEPKKFEWCLNIFREGGRLRRIKSTPAFVAHIPHRVCAPMTTGPSLRNNEWLSPSDEGGQEHFCRHACLQNDKAFIHDFSRWRPNPKRSGKIGSKDSGRQHNKKSSSTFPKKTSVLGTYPKCLDMNFSSTREKPKQRS